MELPGNLQKKIIDFLTSLPNIHDTNSQRSFLSSIALDRQLEDQISFGLSPTQFVQLLVTISVKYGTLKNGQLAIAVILEAAKNYVGWNKSEDCDSLIEEIYAVTENLSQVSRIEKEMPVRAKKRILLLSANPKDSARLRLDKETREIEDGLHRSIYRDQFIIRAKWAVRPRDLRQAMLEFEPDIVHFCGHGKLDGIMVEDDVGKAILVSAEALAGLFELFANQIECVLLNACYSTTQAAAINKHIKYVIGMRTEISDRAAVEFAIGFYDALGGGKSVEESFKFGCNAIQLYNIPEYLTPILFRQLPIHKIVLDLIESSKELCKKNNVPFRTPNLLWPIIDSPDGLFIKQAFDSCDENLYDDISKKVKDYIKEQKSRERGNRFESFEWFDLEEIVTANAEAIQENSNVINGKHLIVGILSSHNGTTKRIKELIGDLNKFYKLINILRNSKIGDRYTYI